MGAPIPAAISGNNNDKCPTRLCRKEAVTEEEVRDQAPLPPQSPIVAHTYTDELISRVFQRNGVERCRKRRLQRLWFGTDSRDSN